MYLKKNIIVLIFTLFMLFTIKELKAELTCEKINKPIGMTFILGGKIDLKSEINLWKKSGDKWISKKNFLLKHYYFVAKYITDNEKDKLLELKFTNTNISNKKDKLYIEIDIELNSNTPLIFSYNNNVERDKFVNFTLDMFSIDNKNPFEMEVYKCNEFNTTYYKLSLLFSKKIKEETAGRQEPVKRKEILNKKTKKIINNNLIEDDFSNNNNIFQNNKAVQKYSVEDVYNKIVLKNEFYCVPQKKHLNILKKIAQKKNISFNSIKEKLNGSYWKNKYMVQLIDSDGFFDSKYYIVKSINKKLNKKMQLKLAVPSRNMINYFQAIQMIKEKNNENFLGNNNWKIPTLEELLYIFQIKDYNGKVKNSFVSILLKNKNKIKFWTSTLAENSRNNNMCWTVYIYLKNYHVVFDKTDINEKAFLIPISN